MRCVVCNTDVSARLHYACDQGGGPWCAGCVIVTGCFMGDPAPADVPPLQAIEPPRP